MMVLWTFLIWQLVFAFVAGFDLRHLEQPQHQQGRIAGGDLATADQFPYQAGLSIELREGHFTWCGGSLISRHWILTAAHCVEQMRSITVYLGAVKRLEPANVLKLWEGNVHLHPDWNTQTLQHDIALLHLPLPVTYTGSIQPVALPRISTTHSTYEYHEAVATGWGRISDSSSLISNELRFVVRFVASNAECQFAYGASVKPTNICIDTTGGKSTCTGDSGGPLVVDDAIDGRTLIGLTSFGKSSGCTNGLPAVFTRVTSYLDWIYKVSGVIRY